MLAGDTRAPFVLVAAALAVSLVTAPARAGECGGDVPCACGDAVVASTKLAASLGPCPDNGLYLRSGVVLDCAGHTLTGTNLPAAFAGVTLDATQAAEVRNCRITFFRRGVRVNAGRNNAIAGNELFANKYGIDLAGGTTGNRIDANLVRDNRDEGIHVGTDSDGNQITNNELRYNKRENLYLLRADGNLVQGNLIHHSKSSAIYVKHSSGNHFVDNEVRDRSLQLRGDSTANLFEDNYLKGDGYLLQAHNEATGWTYPHGNSFVNDLIRKTDWCFRFVGAYDNHATGLRTDGRCVPMSTAARGEVDSSDNTVELAPTPTRTPAPTPTPTPTPEP